MTREQIRAMLPDGTDDAVVTKILDALHEEIQPHKDTAKKASEDLAAKVAEMAEISKKAATNDEKAQAYDELQAKYERDLREANERAAALEFDSMLDGVLREKGARNLKAARALIDLEALRASKNQQEAARAAVDAIAGAEDSAFLFGAQPTGQKTDVGAGTGKAPAAGDGVEAAFQRLNPGMKFD